ncbi:MAG: acyl-CoA synthetase [Paludibacterium sp.]|uniref:LpxL/LpxP family acyltransferase n=1 Tax=Paludibacterium sp. TaxID=1917523 RepID=UPI0025D85E58|nr:acyl-CoA synthetase [Paludibacterium sp.]MBV8045743.1 acyl-CoA synthetase [Paludibacterium sp.]MBV8649752.1 acyl-CoA synthetase [Paludibacterium sp.]
MSRQRAGGRDDAPSWLQQRERGSAAWLGIMCALSLALGRRLSRVVLFGIALYFVLFGGKARRASQAYLTRCLARPVTWRDRYRHVLAFASTIHDRIYLLRDRFDDFDITLDGADTLHREHGAGHGALLFGAHLGSFEVLRAMARHRPELSVSMAMYPENAQRIHRALSVINPAAMQNIITLGSLDAMLAVRDRLEGGALVGILADRAVGPDQYISLPFLGAAARFPTGPFRMAVMLGCPVYFMTGLYQGGNRYHVHFDALTAGGAAAADMRDAAIRDLLERYVAALERQCRAAPYNWFNFYDFWEEG